MGYTTYFSGSFDITLPNEQLENYNQKKFKKQDESFYNIEKTNKTIIDDITPLKALKLVNLLAKTRRMKRDNNKISKVFNIEIPNTNYFGNQGEFFININDIEDFGQVKDDTVIDYNQPPYTQPGLWLQWIVKYDENDNKFRLTWDGGEKFYYYIEWLEYLIENIFKPKNILLNGEIEYTGETSDTPDGVIIVKDNIIQN